MAIVLKDDQKVHIVITAKDGAGNVAPVNHQDVVIVPAGVIAWAVTSPDLMEGDVSAVAPGSATLTFTANSIPGGVPLSVSQDFQVVAADATELDMSVGDPGPK